MAKEITINLNEYKFFPRDYQIPIFENFEDKGYKRLLIIMGRRSGKDISAWNLMIREALRVKGLYVYCLPHASHAKDVIFKAIAKDGTDFLSYIPKECIANINRVEMRIELLNGSHIKFAGSNNYTHSLIGTNLRMIIFSEWARANPEAWPYVLPILVENGGSALFLSTTFGRNHLFDMYNMALQNPDWYVQYMTVEDTKHISIEEINKDIERGVISKDKALQEYWCSWDSGADGAYYAHLINTMHIEDRIDDYSYDVRYPVWTVWDLGLDSHMVVIFFQVIRGKVYIIECHNKTKGGLTEYIKYVKDRPYTYSGHFAPHDIGTRDIGTGTGRWEIARKLGISFREVPKISVDSGIEAVRCMLPITYINKSTCIELVRALENYHREYDSDRQRYSEKPFKDYTEHHADATRYLALVYDMCQESMTADDVKRIRDEAYGYTKSRHPLFE